jgi:hypothetical protein
MFQWDCKEVELCRSMHFLNIINLFRAMVIVKFIGNFWGNAVADSNFASLKKQILKGKNQKIDAKNRAYEMGVQIDLLHSSSQAFEQ